MKSVCLVILDGWGYAPQWGGNPLTVTQPKTFNSLWRSYPKTLLQASGRYVGLPGHEAGNSEVGHLNIGAGRLVHLDQTTITESIKQGSFFQNEVLLEAFHRSRHNHSSVHLMGLVSDGGVHAYLDHLYALLELAANQKCEKLYLHMFCDGRDSPPQSALEYLEKVEQAFAHYKIGKIATVSGRFFAMDRDGHIQRTQRAIEVMVDAIGPHFQSARQAIAASYKQGLSDEYIIPSIVATSMDSPVATIQESDSVIFFNFRADRARQITTYLAKKLPWLYLVTFIPYGFEREINLEVRGAFKPEVIEDGLTYNIARAGLAQFHIAETEKYAHVTYFFNGGIEDPFPGEERLLVASPKVVSFASKPEMAAEEITNQLLQRIHSRRYGFLVVNYANADMIGHTGNIQAAIKAIQVIDEQLKKLLSACLENDTVLMITADHGNIEQMINPATGEVDNQHSTNPVPFIIATQDPNLRTIKLRAAGVLADIAPTILEIMSLVKPISMTGTALQKTLQETV